MLVNTDEIFLNVIDDGRLVTNPFIKHIWKDYNDTDEFAIRKMRIYEINDILVSVVAYFKRVVYKKRLNISYELPPHVNYKKLYLSTSIDKTLVHAVRVWFGFFNNINYETAKQIEDIYYPQQIAYLTNVYNREVGVFIKTTEKSQDEAEQYLSKLHLHYKSCLAELEDAISYKRYTTKHT